MLYWRRLDCGHLWLVEDPFNIDGAVYVHVIIGDGEPWWTTLEAAPLDVVE